MPSKINAAGAGQRPASLAQNPMLAVRAFRNDFRIYFTFPKHWSFRIFIVSEVKTEISFHNASFPKSFVNTYEARCAIVNSASAGYDTI